MKLMDSMKDENLGSALLYSFTKGYGKVPMDVYDVVLPLLYNDGFRDALSDTQDVQAALNIVKNEESFLEEFNTIVDSYKTMTSNAFAMGLIQGMMAVETIDGIPCGTSNETKVLDLNEAILLGKALKDKNLTQINEWIHQDLMSIVFLDHETLGKDVSFTDLLKVGKVTFLTTKEVTDIPSVIKDATVIITNKQVLGEEQLKDASKVKLICVTATGFNQIDIDYCHRRDITVSNVRGYSTDSVAQHTFALALHLYNKNHYYNNYVSSGNYSSSSMFTHFDNVFHELAGKTWGIVGLGDIGRKVASIATVFGCKVQYYSTSGKNKNQDYSSVDFETLLKTSDLISIHAPLNEQTDRLFGLKQFNLMKPTSYLINVGRGPIVQEKALVYALKNNMIAGAGLDVFEKEPFYQDSELLTINDPTKLILTPHVAWASQEARNRVINEVYLNIDGFIKGQKRNAC